MRKTIGRIRLLALISMGFLFLIQLTGPAQAQVEDETRDEPPRPQIDCTDYEDPTYVVIADLYPAEDEQRGGPQSPRAALAQFLADQISPSLRAQNAAEYREAPPVTTTGVLLREDSARARAVGIAEQVGDSWRVEHYEACVGFVKGHQPEQRTSSAVLLGIPLGLAGVAISRKRIRRLAVVGIAVLGLGVFAAPSVAHCAGGDCGFDFYSGEWKADHHTGLNVTWRFTDNFPIDGARDRVREAFARWNGLGQQMKFQELAEVPDYTYDLCESKYHGIHWHDITSIARADVCVHDRAFTTDDVIHTFNIMFDRSRDWYFRNDATLIGLDEIDLEGAAAHEVGHATGFNGPHADGHFDPDSGFCPDTSDRHTMCPNVFLGKTWYRSLEEHDIHTFQNAYP